MGRPAGACGSRAETFSARAWGPDDVAGPSPPGTLRHAVSFAGRPMGSRRGVVSTAGRRRPVLGGLCFTGPAMYLTVRSGILSSCLWLASWQTARAPFPPGWWKADETRPARLSRTDLMLPMLPPSCKEQNRALARALRTSDGFLRVRGFLLGCTGDRRSFFDATTGGHDVGRQTCPAHIAFEGASSWHADPCRKHDTDPNAPSKRPPEQGLLD
ncbi:hypothetical protein PCL_07823 [Purpureocillium lilacinum]|uniref:Uncharacterized protein n=1 Tax=Purpureocillium lilacinum TaxID=33203 RepID=A0A2U3EJ26_PURLI|nr:hypothetical protein PCL_07823 [Purpureocillium lilacinum]